MEANLSHEPCTPSATIIIPAHNESRTIGRALEALTRNCAPNEFDIVVVCNGCNDETATIARRFDGVTVIEIPQPSKTTAIQAGDRVAIAYPRVYMDADVELDTDAARALVYSLADGEVLAAAPARLIPRDQVSCLVRWYYDVWELLPQVVVGLFGRGVIALSAEGHRRFKQVPTLMSDDLAMSEVFSENERTVVNAAVVVVRPPRTVRDLLKRRVRVATGNTQAEMAGIRRSESKTSPKTLASIVRSKPIMILRMPTFLGITLVARILSRRAVRSGDFSTWQRDESSRR